MADLVGANAPAKEAVNVPIWNNSENECENEHNKAKANVPVAIAAVEKTVAPEIVAMSDVK